MKSVYYAALMVFAAISTAAVTVQSAEDNGVSDEALSVSVIALSKVIIPMERDVEAKLVSPNDTPVSPELAAKVLQIDADVGDEVQEGDILARLDCRDYDVKVRQAKAGVATVNARILAAKARAGAAESRVGAAESRVNASASRVHAAESRVKAAMAGIHAATARMNATATGINTAKSQANTAKAQAAAARARIPSAQAQFKLAQAELNRNRQLRNNKLVPANILDQAQATFGSAQSSLSAAQADYAAAQSAVSTANEAINAAQANLQAGKSDVESSRANVETMKAEFNSAKADLGSSKADLTTAKPDAEGSGADLLTVKTELENALAQQEAAEVVAERCFVKAPFDGQITQRQFQLGQISTPGMAAFQLLQHQGLEVVAQLSPDEVRNQEQGEKVRFVSNGMELDIERRAVVAQVASGSGTQEVRYRINSEHTLPVGETGRVRWQGKLPAVPASWLLRREGGLGLMLAVDGKAEFYPLKDAREGQSALVDLPTDTLLIDANRLRVRHGQHIKQSGK